MWNLKVEFQKRKKVPYSHMQTLNHAMTYLVSIRESVLTPPHQDAFVKRDLLENDAKKVIEEDTWGVELKFFLFKINRWLWNQNYFNFIASLEIKTRKEEKKNEYHPINDRQPKCAFDCKSFGHICCRLGNGIEECRTKDNCPDPGKHF